ncbi:sigma 54-interacting transcriptional regulator [Solibacillus isronensis]|uniref:sigma 54-interacting transcriptional regulator n=1 Tax=Solibacillus isronensis TaxID=412383 RepID=UPI00158FE878|nr:sigma 54-interacting transcriptional regulator [Solibacillus isronensis]
MLKLLVSGSYPLVDYVKDEIQKRRDSVQNLVVQEVSSLHILNHPNYINNDDILICGVVLAERLKKLNVRGYIVPLRVQTQDFIKALMEASKYSKKVCVVNYYKEFINEDKNYNEVKLKEILGLNIEQHVYTSAENAEEVVKELSKDTQNVIIGSGLIVNLAKKHGMKGILWYDQETIQLAVGIAFDILRAKVLERSNQKRQSIVMENFHDGIISLNQMNRIININQAAIKILELEQDKNYESNYISEILDKGELLEEILSPKEAKDSILKYKNKSLMMDKHIIHVDKTVDGNIIILSDIEALQQKENKVRRKLNKKYEGAIYTFDDIIGQSNQTIKAKMKAQKFARADANVLILGESGTGKELFAQSIHNASNRYNQPFIAVNCAAIPENLLESEFFGYSEGAFTGAIKGGKPGLFEIAHNGTLFLDEIGELPLSMQAKLLRVLQEKNVRRVGASTSVPVDVRIISATNVNLIEGVRSKEFRMDLYYRIAVLNLFLPDLNKRKEDIGLLLRNYTNKNYKGLSPIIDKYFDSLVSILESHSWEGNVREFENTIERLFAYIGSDNEIEENLIIEYLEESIKENEYLLYETQSINETFQQTMKEIEVLKIKEILEQTNGNKKEAADILGISRSTLWRKMNEFNLK